MTSKHTIYPDSDTFGDVLRHPREDGADLSVSITGVSASRWSDDTAPVRFQSVVVQVEQGGEFLGRLVVAGDGLYDTEACMLCGGVDGVSVTVTAGNVDPMNGRGVEVVVADLA